VFLARSTDRGATWSLPVRVNDDRPGSDQVMPWVSVNANGVVETFWYDYRNWTGMNTTDVYAARSTDGGQSFGANFRVTTAPSSWFVPATFTPNFGDYIQCASEGTGFYPAWADGRNNDIDVFAGHIATDTCGNGALDAFEECDDGNTLDGDSCSGACAVTLCGNGLLDGVEPCDDGNIQSGDGCSQTCRLEVCGDGVFQPGNREECDDGNLTPGDGCSTSCQAEPDRIVWIADERSRLVLESITTGRVMPIGDPGFHEMGDLAFDATGRLFGATQFNINLSIGYNGALLDLATLGLPGRGSLIGWAGWLALTAIDFHPLTGVLYGIAVDAAGTSRLITLDPATGATASIVGDLVLLDARAMAFDAAGTLYVATSSLYTVDPATAGKTLVGGPIFSSVILSGMDFAPDGTLYGIALRGTGADGGLLRVNKATGAGTVLFISGRPNQQGIRFAPPIAVDRDLDGIHDVLDCAPSDPANPPPGVVADLRFTDQATFTWSAAASARFHNAYRGTIPAPLGTRLPGSVFDHVCFESADTRADGDLLSADTSAPPPGTAYYYLAGGEGCGEGPLGSDAAHPAPNPSPCPTPP
jgi:cysteine-rich repeat protein